MSEIEPLDIEILSPTGKKSEKNANKRCTTKTTLLVIIFLLVVLCFVFVLLCMYWRGYLTALVATQYLQQNRSLVQHIVLLRHVSQVQIVSDIWHLILEVYTRCIKNKVNPNLAY